MPDALRTAGESPPAGVGGRSPSRTRDLGILALVILGPVWGYGWVATKVALDYSDAMTFAALRVPLSAGLLFLVDDRAAQVTAAAAASATRCWSACCRPRCSSAS